MSQRIHRDDQEEFLFSLHPVFVTADGTIDDVAAKVSLECYGITLNSEPEVHFQPDTAFEIAKCRLQAEVKAIWDWDEDVSLLNLALIAFGT